MLRWIRSVTPWWARIGVKVTLAGLPVPYSVWKSLGICQHGQMDQPHSALDGFMVHARSAEVLDEDERRFTPRSDNGFSVLEVGPGDSLFDAQIASALGAHEVWMVDARAYATTSVAAYVQMSDLLRDRGWAGAATSRDSTLRDLLVSTNTRYLTEGVGSLRVIPSDWIDYSFSNGVLEHLPVTEFDEFARELFRVHKPGSVSVHRVDLKDHIGGSLHHLRFGDRVWNSRPFTAAVFATNRLRQHQILKAFTDAGFTCRTTNTVRWEQLPLPRSALASPFAQMPEEELAIAGFDVILSVPEITTPQGS